MKDGIDMFKNLSRREKYQHFLVWGAIALFLVFLIFFNQSVEKNQLLEENGNQFEKAEVVEILSENRNEDGSQQGTQTVKVKLKSGEFKGKVVEATNIDSYLYGADCKVGASVIVQVSEYDGQISASIYNYNRTMILFAMVGIFLLSLVLIGRRKGVTSALGLIFTFICILYLYLPMLYLGASPFLSAVLVTILTTLVTMYFIGGFSKKTLCSIIGTVGGVVIAGCFANLFGKIGHITGYNVSDIETLLYIGQNSKLQIGGLLFSGILIASLGAVMDVAMSIATTIEELQFHNPDLTRRQLFKSGIKIGGDMMGTMSNTLILAFTGSAFVSLLVLFSYNVDVQQLMNSNYIAIEFVQGIAGTLGIVLTVPIASLIASTFLVKQD